MMDSFAFPVSGPLGFIGLDAADVVGSTLHQLIHQIVGLCLGAPAKRQTSTLGCVYASPF